MSVNVAVATDKSHGSYRDLKQRQVPNGYFSSIAI